jgi:hypothetical protein
MVLKVNATQPWDESLLPEPAAAYVEKNGEVLYPTETFIRTGYDGTVDQLNGTDWGGNEKFPPAKVAGPALSRLVESHSARVWFAGRGIVNSTTAMARRIVTPTIQ